MAVLEFVMRDLGVPFFFFLFLVHLELDHLSMSNSLSAQLASAVPGMSEVEQSKCFLAFLQGAANKSKLPWQLSPGRSGICRSSWALQSLLISMMEVMSAHGKM